MLWSKFQKQFLPEDEWWQGNTDKGIEIVPGTTVQSGRCKTYTLGNWSDVHCIINANGKELVKQGFLHSLITNACCKYGPEDLVLQVIQLKRRVPVNCSSNAQYITSLPHRTSLTFGEGLGRDAIKQLRVYADSIYDRLQESGHTSLESYNMYIRSNAFDLDIISRRLVIINDADVLFDCMNEDAVRDLYYIMEISRVVGVHIIYVFNYLDDVVLNDLTDTIFKQCTLRFNLYDGNKVECQSFVEDRAPVLCDMPEMWFQDVDDVSKRMWAMLDVYEKF